MLEKIVAFFMAIVAFFCNLLGINQSKIDTEETEYYDAVVDMAYGTGEREKMDIAYPKNASGKVDVVLNLHGGAWVAGDKSTYNNETLYTAKLGYIGVQMNYSYISDTVHCDTLLDEITMALKAVKADAANRGITIEHYAIRGQSAGAHLATLYAYSRGNESGIEPAFVINQCGPNALEYISMLSTIFSAGTLGTTEYISSLFTNLCGVTVTTDNLETAEVKAALEQVSATHFVSTAVPTITCHGTLDTIVPYVNATILDGLLASNGVEHYLFTYPTSGHTLQGNSDLDEQACQMALDWCAKYLNKYSA